MRVRLLVLTGLLLAALALIAAGTQAAAVTRLGSGGAERENLVADASAKADLRINEFMAINTSTLLDPADGDADDWFEIYNAGLEDVNMEGLYLTDHLSATTQFHVGQPITVPARGYVIFWADDETAQGPEHVNFRLGALGEEIGIYDVDGLTRIDGYTYGPQVADVSQGRFLDGQDNWVSFDEPTPGSSNRWRPPSISDTLRTPLAPAVSDPVTVTAQISDNGALLTTTLFYSVAGSGFLGAPMAAQGNDLFAAAISPQSEGSPVGYYVLAGDDDGQLTTDPPDAPRDVYAYRVGYQAPLLFINEFMAANDTALEDPDEPGDFPDWFELYNPGLAAVDLGGLYLTDDLDEPTKFRITDSLVISAGGYVLFYADGSPEQGRFHTSFALSAGGESIGLFDREIAAHQRIDAHTFGVQTPDVSEGRCPDGGAGWFPLTSSTPGRSNAPCGPAPVISNVGHSPALPSATGGVTVTASITDDGTLVSTTVWFGTGTAFVPIPMAALGGDVYSATIPPQKDGTWVMYYVAAGDDEGLSTVDPPGAPTRTHRYLVGYQPPVVYLNEFMASNTAVLEDPDEPGQYPDWIELYNAGPAVADLGGLYLTDDLDEPAKFRITDGITLPAGGFILFFADSSPEQGVLHTNFGLRAAGEALGLFGAEGTVQLDATVFSTQTSNLSFGRLPDGTGAWGFRECPTPGKANDACYRTYLPLAIKGF